MEEEQFWTELSSSLIDKTIGNEEYQLLEPLGHGAYGCLFLGQSLKGNTTYVAIKVISKSNEQFLLETDIQSSLKHPHILALHHLFQDNEFFYLVMELCDAGDLFDFVIQDSTTLRDELLVKKFFTQILDAVQYMHQQGVYHRDLKLENILLQSQDDDTDKLDCKVADFGLATRERYSTEFGYGSPSYLAPEHFDNNQPYYDAAASDVWSLGILLLALMFGRNPWQEANASSDPTFNSFSHQPLILKDKLFPELSTSTFHLIKSVLSMNASDRISVSEFKDQFLAIDHLYVDVNEDDGYISIPTATTKKQNIHSFDSAFFSGGNGMSWSDMIEEEEASIIPTISPLSQSYEDQHQDDEDDDMFIHSHEKESWWL